MNLATLARPALVFRSTSDFTSRKYRSMRSSDAAAYATSAAQPISPIGSLLRSTSSTAPLDHVAQTPRSPATGLPAVGRRPGFRSDKGGGLHFRAHLRRLPAPVGRVTPPPQSASLATLQASACWLAYRA